MENILALKCLICGKLHRPEDVDYVCPDHGDDGILDVLYDYDSISRQFDRETLLQSSDRTIWRYRPLLPVNPETAVPPLSVVGKSKPRLIGPKPTFLGESGVSGAFSGRWEER